MPVTSRHTEYSTAKGQWDLTRDAIAGSCAIKGCAPGGSTGLWSTKGTKYLPPPNPSDTSEENIQRYMAYLFRAVFLNVTGFTLEALSGMIYRVNPSIELPTRIEYLNTDANGEGLSLTQLSQSISDNLIATGRHGLLVDYPSVESGVTIAQVANRGLQARIIEYPAESIINWRIGISNNGPALTLVVLEEAFELIDSDGFGSTNELRYRVLRLTGGVYTQEILDENGGIISPEFAPRNASGATFSEILFTFVGSVENDTTVDKSPIYDIAELNIGHYRNSADFEESSFTVGQPTTVINGLTQTWVDDNYSDGVLVGSRRGLLLPIDSDAHLMQAEPNIMPQEAMARKEQQMIMIGARIIQEQQANETATGADIRSSAQASKLSLIVENTEAAINKTIVWISEFMGETGEFLFEMNREFTGKDVNPQVLMAQIQMLDRGVIAKSDMRRGLRSSDILAADRKDDDIDAEASVVNPIL